MSFEIGNPFEQKPLNNLTSYCGIIPRVKQSGGIEGHTHTGRVSKRSNHLLKDYVVQSAFHIGLRGPESLLQDYKRREATGQHADFGVGRRFLRYGHVFDAKLASLSATDTSQPSRPKCKSAPAIT